MKTNILLLGAGNSRKLLVKPAGSEGREENILTLDIDETCNPDIVHDLNQPMPFFADAQFDEIHAYEVLEHLGRQGDYEGFFKEFTEYCRILRFNGFIFGSCPVLTSNWVWGDPGHTRYIGPETFVFLDQDIYKQQVGNSPMTDYRSIWKGDFKLIGSEVKEHRWFFGLQKK